jgi:hypothetical protein
MMRCRIVANPNVAALLTESDCCGSTVQWAGRPCRRPWATCSHTKFAPGATIAAEARTFDPPLPKISPTTEAFVRHCPCARAGPDNYCTQNLQPIDLRRKMPRSRAHTAMVYASRSTSPAHQFDMKETMRWDW